MQSDLPVVSSIVYTCRMIISHKYKFIFLKVSKTAGTSLELALAQFCGPDDVVSSIISSRAEPHLQAQEQAYQQKYPHYKPRHNYTPFEYYSWREWKDLICYGRWDEYYNHMSAQEVLQRIDLANWQNYYKFCFTRNPWERVVTAYYFKRMQRQDTTLKFADFVNPGTLHTLMQTGYYIYTINDNIMVDKVYQFENLSESLKDIEQKLKLPAPINMQRENTNREQKATKQDLYDEALSATVGNAFHKEIELFDYKF